MISHRSSELERARDRRLRDALGQLATTGPEPTRSEMEIRFLSLIAQFDLPRPRVNARTQGLTVDFLWPDHGLMPKPMPRPPT